MQADLNQCKIHPEKTKNKICKKCKQIFCSKCSKKAHETHNPISFSSKLLKTHELLGYLGKGSFGYVLSAFNPLTKMAYALKIIENVNDESILKETSIEIQTLCQLQHVNIIRFFSADYIKKEERIIIHMELADQSLSNVIKTLDLATAITYFSQICEGLKYLHQSHFIHKDLKPGNILIKDGMAKLADLGLTKKREKTMMSFSKLFGTFSYLPPEVLKGQKFNEKVDVWAIGVIFHQMLSSGENPFKGVSEEETTSKILDPNIKLDQKICKNAKLEKIIRGKTFFFILIFSFLV